MFSFLNFIYILIYIFSNSITPFPLYTWVILGHRQKRFVVVSCQSKACPKATAASSDLIISFARHCLITVMCEAMRGAKANVVFDSAGI